MADDYEVRFSTKLKRPEFLRIGIVVACGLVLLVSAAVTMAASPAASPGASGPAAGQASPAPGNGNPWTDGSGRRRMGMGGGWTNGDAMPGFGAMPGIGAMPGMPGLGDRGMGKGPGRGLGFGRITITAIDGSQLSLRTADGWTRTITVTSSTAITKGGQTIAAIDLKVGDTIRFRETRNSDGTFAITAIDVVQPEVFGSVTAVSGSGFTVKSPDGTTWTVTVTGSTTYGIGGQSGSSGQVKVGDEVGVEGTQTGTNALSASAVRIAPAIVAGQVTAKTDSTITVKAFDGSTATIHVGGGTTYRMPGVSNPGLANITVGSVIVAQGTRNADGSLNATVVRGGNGMGMGRGWMKGGPNGPQSSAAPGASGTTNQG